MEKVNNSNSLCSLDRVLVPLRNLTTGVAEMAIGHSACHSLSSEKHIKGKGTKEPNF